MSLVVCAAIAPVPHVTAAPRAAQLWGDAAPAGARGGALRAKLGHDQRTPVALSQSVCKAKYSKKMLIITQAPTTAAELPVAYREFLPIPEICHLSGIIFHAQHPHSCRFEFLV